MIQDLKAFHGVDCQDAFTQAEYEAYLAQIDGGWDSYVDFYDREAVIMK